MYNILQPVVDLTNANIETLSRFANSREVTELAKDSASKYFGLVQDNMAKVTGSEAFATCLQTTVDNYVRFANDYTKNVYGIVAQGQEFVVEEGNKRLAQVADISGRAVQAGTESVKSAGKEALNEADQAARPNRGK
jgi:hypothetical protein